MSQNPFGSSPVIAVGADPRGESGPVINAGEFWPQIDPITFREAMRIDGSATEPRIRAALVESIISVNESLAAFKAEQINAGTTTLSATSSETIDNIALNVHRWTRAVHCLAAANIAERYRGVDATGAGNQKADLVESPIDDLRRDAFWAIADILGRSRSVIELI